MKKMLCLMLIIVMTWAVGCGNNEPVNTTPRGESKQTETTTQEQKTAFTEEPTETTTLESQNDQNIQEQISSGILALYHKIMIK